MRGRQPEQDAAFAVRFDDGEIDAAIGSKRFTIRLGSEAIAEHGHGIAGDGLPLGIVRDGRELIRQALGKRHNRQIDGFDPFFDRIGIVIRMDVDGCRFDQDGCVVGRAEVDAIGG